jgi:thiosulfate dehydrogenase [quinone] large subunit
MQLSNLAHRAEFADPPWYRAVFANTGAAPFWLLVRLYVGWQWLHAGWEKVTGEGWVNDGGSSLESFWSRIVLVPEDGRPAITYGWYRDFIQYMLDAHWFSWFAPLVAYGEVLVGIGLIVGAFTAVSALFGATLNFNFMLAGSASTNPVLFILTILLVLAWKVAGHIGMDRWLLPALGTPWSRSAPPRGRSATPAGPRSAPGIVVPRTVESSSES